MELCLSDCGKYRGECLTASTLPGALEVMQRSHFKDGLGAIVTGLNINPAPVEELLDLCVDIALDGLSVVAIEIATGEVVSVAFNKLQAASEEPIENDYLDQAIARCTQETAKDFIKFMAQVNSQCNIFEKYDVDCSLKMWFLATVPEHRNKHVAFMLCKTSLDLAKKLKHGHFSQVTLQDLGPKYAHIKPRPVTRKVPTVCYAFATSVASQKMAKALGFTVLVRVPFRDIVVNGKSCSERAGFDPHLEAVAYLLE